MSAAAVAFSLEHDDCGDRSYASKAPERTAGVSYPWIARSVIVGVAAALAWYTWGHWGDLQIDSGREMYVPASILQGKLLYRDLWYMYGPLAPYMQALAFRIFGVSLNVLYGLGLTLTITCALLIFEIARQFDLVIPAAAAPAIFFLAESFSPFIFSFVFPYSYSASIACVLGLACLYFALRHARRGRTREVALAALFAGIAVLTKQEFGLACLLLVAFEVTASSILQRAFRIWMRSTAVCIAGLSPAIAVYGWFIWKVSARTLLLVNWSSTPGTYFMRTLGKRTTAAQGFRFIPLEWLFSLDSAVISLGLWFAIAVANCVAIRRLRLRSSLSMATLVLADLLVALVALQLDAKSEALPILLAQAVFPKGIFLLGLFFVGQAIWKMRHPRDRAIALADACLGIYAMAVGLRVMMELAPGRFHYATFFNPPIFIVFVVMISRVIRFACQSIDKKSLDRLVGVMISVEAGLLLMGFVPKPDLLPTPLKTDFGTIYTTPGMAAVFPQVISFMKEHTRNKRDIVVLPEAPSLYFFAGMQAPTRWYTAEPGIIDPVHQEELARNIAANNVEYLLIPTRSVKEYGIAGFGIGYNQVIYHWLMEHYSKVGQFGPTEAKSQEPFLVEVYKKDK